MKLLRNVIKIVAVLTWAATGVSAQEAEAQQPRIVTSPILTLSLDQLFSGSAFGKRVIQERDEALTEMRAEDEVLADELRAEEQELTELRDTLPMEEFRLLADDFNVKAEDIRAQQLNKQLAISRRVENEQRRFFTLLDPVREALMSEANAILIVDSRSVFAQNPLIDATARAIFHADQLIGDGRPSDEQSQ